MKFINVRIIAASILKIRSFFFKKKPEFCIVTLHNIPEKNFKWFEDFIDLIDKTYGFINPNDFLAKRGSIDNGVLLTFDDGFRSNRVIAENILKKYNVKAVFFVTEKFVGLQKKDSFRFSQKNFYPNSEINQEEEQELMAMSWSDIDWLIDNGHTIGAHTATHKVLAKIKSLDLLQDEVEISANRLENKIKQRVRVFAFPFGTPDSVSIKAFDLAKSRFDYVFSNVRGGANKSPNDYFLFRQNITPGDPLWLVKLIIDGQFDWKHKKNMKIAFKKFITK
jgi:peptidoglycan/xylan/chitin deacetylase (PgdA/CDA1 family)